MNCLTKLFLLILSMIYFSSAQEVRTIVVGSLQSWYRADGCEPFIK